MKRKLPLISLMLALVFVVGGYFAYDQYVRPMYHNNFGQTIELDLEKSTTYSLGKIPEQDGIFGLEIEIEGKTDEIIGLLFSNGKEAIHHVRLKDGEIDFVYKNDWYTDSLFVQIDKKPNETGKLTMTYRFLGL